MKINSIYYEQKEKNSRTKLHIVYSDVVRRVIYGAAYWHTGDITDQRLHFLMRSFLLCSRVYVIYVRHLLRKLYNDEFFRSKRWKETSL